MYDWPLTRCYDYTQSWCGFLLSPYRRCFSALGFDKYEESYSDGLQILRYNVSKAYNSHLDWIEDTVS